MLTLTVSGCFLQPAVEAGTVLARKTLADTKDFKCGCWKVGEFRHSFTVEPF